MKGNILILTCLLGVGWGQPALSQATTPQPPVQHDPASEVRAVFRATCASCHGANLPKPRGGFGYILDLAVARNPKLVVPSRPDESELWKLVRRGEMPPPDSLIGRLNAQQKETIRAWIAAGAPAPADSLSQDPERMPRPSAADERTAQSADGRFLRWLGKGHILALHFPIALLFAAAVAECWFMVRGSRVGEPAVRFCLLFGAGAAVVTVALGWLHALGWHGVSAPGTLAVHSWLGTAAGLWAVVTVVVYEWVNRRGGQSLLARVLLFVGALLIGLTAHFGGILTHGEDFFTL